MIAKCTLTTLLLLASISAISCTTQIPVATNYEYTEQQKMQAAHHWDVLAADVVEQLNQSQKICSDTPIYVVPKFYVPNEEDTTIFTTTKPLTPTAESDRFVTIPFKRAYQNYLISELVNAGYNIVDNADAAVLQMIFDIQLVKHADRPVRSADVVSKIGRVLAGSADGAYVGIEASRYEVVITTSVKSGEVYVTSHTGTYYVNTPLWDSNYAMQGKIMEVVSR